MSNTVIDSATAAITTPKPAVRRFRMNSATWGIASAILFVLVWWLSVVIFQPKAYILPSPLAVADRFFTAGPMLWDNAWPTISVILLGFLIGLAIAVPLGMLIVAFPLLDRLVYPLVVAFNAVPKVALAPLFVIWFGYGVTPRIVVTFAIAFFPILVNTITGLRSVDNDMIRLSRSMGGSTPRIFMKVRFPHALPSIFAGMKVGTSLAVIGAIIGEFIASDRGWGYMLLAAQGTLDTPLIFAILVLLAIFATILFYLVDFIERLTIPWHSSQRNH